ncbi:MAG: TetR/AcrR family transcriptional regulator, partial [Pseudomonadota bacterium]
TFGKHPGASLAEVAKLAGVGRATLHRHFSSRETLMLALARTAMEELDTAIEAAAADAESHTDALRRILTAAIPLAERQWFLTHEPVMQDPAIKAAYRSDHEALCAAVDAAKAEGTFDPTVPTRWIAEAYEGLIFTAWAMVRDEEITPNQAADLAWRTLTGGLAAVRPDQEPG